MPSRQAAETLYETNLAVATVFWEWRHKVLSFALTVASAAIGITVYAATHQPRVAVDTAGHQAKVNSFIAAMPLLLAGFALLAALGMDHRNRQIIKATFRAGAALEDEMRPVASGDGELVFAWLLSSKEKRGDERRKGGVDSQEGVGEAGIVHSTRTSETGETTSDVEPGSHGPEAKPAFARGAAGRSALLERLRTPTYSVILTILYLGAALLCLGGGIYVWGGGL
jgi:hypothetical protein